MKVAFIDIQNFRKLKKCRVEFSEKETIFVGANNSGKTSAMDALMVFLKKTRRKDLSTTDFTLSNWRNINQIADDWMGNQSPANLSENDWQQHVPSIDIWLDVEDSEVHYVSHIIPTLDWRGGRLGVRLLFEPNKIEDLYKAYKAAYEAAKNTSALHENALRLWPQSMQDFLDKELHAFFTVNAYILDPSKCTEQTCQDLPENSEPIEGNPFDGLFKIDIINAQRGFSDPYSGGGSSNNHQRLSEQLKGYYAKHLNPSDMPEANDLDALGAIEAARTAFDKRLKVSFKASIDELEGLNYPGFSDPEILITSKVNPIEGLNHDAAVQFRVLRNDDSPVDLSLCLPEKYNGLGYQNLISMIFNLIRFRDEWMRVGKAERNQIDNDTFLEPLHLVLIEEPEVHLHAQVQQVFIKKAYAVLRNNSKLGDNSHFSTQLIISTHSSHIAHEIDFNSLRYFKRVPAARANDVPCASVVNLNNTFGDDSDTSKFAIRYLKATHCDLFFADAAILVEGPAERMLIPHFIRNKFPGLDRSYLSLLEIGGSHAHKLRPLIEALGLLTLVITDLDSIGSDSRGKVQPEKGEGYRTGNYSIRSWVPEKIQLDDVLAVREEDKVKDGFIRIAYQTEVSLTYADEEVTAIPYTFEDALVLSNIKLFKDKSGARGLINKMVTAVQEATISEACEKMFDALDTGSNKAEMALELLFTTEPSDLEPPQYIAEGLVWLQDVLNTRNSSLVIQIDNQGGANE